MKYSLYAGLLEYARRLASAVRVAHARATGVRLVGCDMPANHICQSSR